MKKIKIENKTQYNGKLNSQNQHIKFDALQRSIKLVNQSQTKQEARKTNMTFSNAMNGSLATADLEHHK